MDGCSTVYHSAGMSRIYSPLLNLGILCGLAGCGEHLGDYQVHDVVVVRQVSLADWPSRNLPYSRFLRVEISSTKNLNTAEIGPGLYTRADFCPLKSGNTIITFGPETKDGHSLSKSKRQAPLTPDSEDGLYHYVIYIVTKSGKRTIGSPDIELDSYDLSADGRSICVQIFVPGYNVIPSRSNNIEIPASAVLRALSNPDL